MERPFASTAGSLAAVLGLTAGATCAAAPAPDPYVIFDHARHAAAAQQYPAYLAYTVAVNVTEGGVDKSRHYHLVYDSQNGTVDVDPVSDEERAAPPVPNGVVVHLQPRRQNKVIYDKKVGNPGEALDFLGVPLVTPTYTFGLDAAGASETGENSGALIAQIRKEFNDPTPVDKLREEVTTGPIKVIAVETSRTREYTIRLAGTETISGHECYHLLLTPNGDPKRLRLRELWVDAQSYQPWQLLNAGNFTGSQANWLVTFAQIGGSTYVVSETAQAPIGVGDHHYQHASVAFESIAQTTRPVRTNFFITGQQLMTEPDDGAPH
jgi:hypothetical protein